MSEKTTAYRLVKVANELNISIHTIAEHLNKKGFSIEDKPTAKIDQAMYEILLKDFQSDRKAKEESKSLEIHHHRFEEVTKPQEKPKNQEPEFVENEILIKNTGFGDIPVKEDPEPAKEKKQDAPGEEEKEVSKGREESKVEFKVIGKINLDDLKKSGNKPKESEKSDTKESNKVVEPAQETVTEAKTEPKEEPKAEVPAEPKIEKKEEPKVEKPVAPVSEPKVEPVVEAKPEVESASSEKEKSQEEKAVHIVEETKSTDEPLNEKKDSQITEIKKTTPELPVVEPKEPEISSEQKTEDVKSGVMQPKLEKLQGLTIMGKIQLPVEPVRKKQPIASSDASSSDFKKKRKRKIVGKPDTGTPTGTGTGGAKPPQKPFEKGKFSKPYKKPEKTEPKGEITDKEIQDKIKSTLAKLGGGQKGPAGSRSKLRKQKRDSMALSREEHEIEMEKSKKTIQVTEFVSANELASLMDVSVNEIITTCFSLGMMVSINQRLDAETITIVADEFGFKVEFVNAETQEAIQEEPDLPEDLVPRPPIVTVMGHVDHGKTSLLDHIRKTNVIAGEAGGITQHIGAYNVRLENGKQITFQDTPGHEAFTAMRARGAKVTDIVIVVIAADDSVMPQTKEAISHAQAASVPIVFAINKIDRDGANPDKIREQLAGMNILVEEWGGKFQCQEISAKKGLNIDLLLDKVLLEAEILELKANPNRNASGTVIEAQLDKGRGIVATMLVQNGTLRVGDNILAGCYHGRIKALFNERNQKIDKAGPSSPVMVLGFNGAPQAGDKFTVLESEHEAKEIANKRLQLQREQGIRTHKHITLDEIGRRLAIGNFKELKVIVKGDVDGSVEALSDSLLKLSTEEVQVNVIHKSVGQITESDVLLASASDAIIIGFQVRPAQSARKLAETEQIDIRMYSVIYKAIDEIKAAMEGLLEPKVEEKVICTVDVREVFHITKIGTIAGCMVTDGKIHRNTKIRVIRDGVVVHTGELDSLKRFKDDVKEVSKGYECGLNIKNFNNIQVGDIIEGYEEVEVKRKL